MVDLVLFSFFFLCQLHSNLHFLIHFLRMLEKGIESTKVLKISYRWLFILKCHSLHGFLTPITFTSLWGRVVLVLVFGCFFS